MKALHVFFNKSQNEFLESCKSQKIRTRKVKKGSGTRHCTGPYTFVWIESQTPNYIYYANALERGEQVEVLFYTEAERNEFEREISTRYSIEVLLSFQTGYYYKMEDVFGLKFKVK